MKAGKPRRLQKKKKNSYLVKNIQTWWWVTNPNELALVLQACTFSTGSSFPLLLNLILIINPSTGGVHDQLSFSPTQPFLYPTVQLVTQIHWKLPWSHNSTSGLLLLGVRDIMGGGGHAYYNSVLSFAFFLFYPVISLWALVMMFKPSQRSVMNVTDIKAHLDVYTRHCRIRSTQRYFVSLMMLCRYGLTFLVNRHVGPEIKNKKKATIPFVQ